MNHTPDLASYITMCFLVNPALSKYSYLERTNLFKTEILQFERLSDTLIKITQGGICYFRSDAEENDRFSSLQKFAKYLDNVQNDEINIDTVYKFVEKFMRDTKYNDAFISKIDDRLQFLLPILNN